MVNLESKKLEGLLKLTNGLLLLVLINMVVSKYYFRLDLTEEKRFSISIQTRQMLKNLDEKIYIEVYLDGDLPAGFKRLQEATRETLEEFRVYSDNKVQYSFINPDLAASAQSRDEYMRGIAEKGIQPTDIFLNENGKQIQKRILPGAVITYGTREVGVMLLKGNKGASSEVQLNQSAEGVEYQLASTIRALTKEKPEVVGLTRGHGELSGNDIVAFRTTLAEQYSLVDIDLFEKSGLKNIDLIILAKPQLKFSSLEKYNLDQFLVGGGKIIFLLDAVKAELDTLSLATPYNLDLDDQLFKYGVRVNKDLVQDIFALSEPVVVGNMGDEPQIQMLPWPFYPLINNFTDHPIVRNLDALGTSFISSIDTIKAVGIKKTPLFTTSPYSRTLSSPLRINIDELKKPIRPEDFTQSNITLGYLLEGEFTSAFKNRPLPQGVDKDYFIEIGKSAFVVVGDGDIVRNRINPQTGNPMPLGFDIYSRQTFANEEFLLNTIQYLLDDQGLIQARNKEIVLRPLDKVRVEQERRQWQILNLLLPVLLIIIYGLVSHYLRKRKYASF